MNIRLFTTLLLSTLAFAQPGKKSISCDVVILGGGAGGLHTAFRLAPSLGDRVCLFEKEDRLGGRIYDVSRTPGGPVFGLGALRIMETQDVVFNLADELGIPYVAAPFSDDLIRARGNAAHDSDTLRTLAYPKTTNSEGALYDQFRLGPERSKVAQYPDLRSYMRASLGAENYQFVADMFRFRGDFTYPVSAKAYLEFLDEDWDVCCTPSYPVGGMSEFIKRMAARASQRGVRIYTSEPAIEIESGPGNSGRYRITTPSYNVTANRLVIAIDAEGFKRVGGELARRIQNQPQFQDLIGIKVASINQWWPSAWWQNAIPGKNTRRVWSTETCVNHIEIPTTPYAANQLVTRSVYQDDKTCTDFWEETLKRGVPAVEAEIERGLKTMFSNTNIPKPVKTEARIWPAGWYFVRAGSPYSNMDIAQWALTPLAGEAVSLVGEAYNPQRSTWSDGAYKSSINTLNSIFGLNLPGQTASPNGPVPQPGKGKKSYRESPRVR